MALQSGTACESSQKRTDSLRNALPKRTVFPACSNLASLGTVSFQAFRLYIVTLYMIEKFENSTIKSRKDTKDTI